MTAFEALNINVHNGCTLVRIDLALMRIQAHACVSMCMGVHSLASVCTRVLSSIDCHMADLTEKMVMEALQHVQEILWQPNTYNILASRVLDNVYHFMDRLL
jgi:hypothetical protein